MHGAQRGDRQRQVAPEDVRVEEQRVDPEVDVQLVGVEELGIEEQIARVRTGRSRSAAQTTATVGDHGEHPPEQGTAPLDLGEQHEQGRERNQEEADVLDRVGDVLGVGGLDRVEDQRCREQAPKPERPRVRVPGARRRVPGARRSALEQRAGDHSGRDHEVERDEQVRGLAADLERDPQGQDGEGGDRERLRVTAKERGEGGEGERPGDHRRSDLRRAVAEVDHPRLVPDVAEHEHRRGGQRDRQRDQAGPAAVEHQRGSRRAGCDQDARQLERRGGQPASSLPAPHTGAVVGVS